MTAEQKRIDAELEKIRNTIFGDKEKRDSLENQTADSKETKKAQKERRQKAEKVKPAKSSTKSSRSSSSGGSVSVRRQRH